MRMKNKTVHIFWDNSQLWGLMALRAIKTLGIKYRLVKSTEIAQGVLLRKHAAILLTPGGSARKKAAALGEKGAQAIKQWLRGGGLYLGFCGGAGLALRQPEYGLGICPWQRLAFPDRLYHLVSGHLWTQGPRGIMALPVWWPARFEEDKEASVQILARYQAPGPDLWLADLPLAEIPQRVWSRWRNAGRLDQALDFAPGQPLAVQGKYGLGSYILSYAHLETPQSPDANAWLARLLSEAGAEAGSGHVVPQWDTAPQTATASIQDQLKADIAKAHARFWKLIILAEKGGFLFQRAPWLRGWRRGMPGMACNHLLACFAMLMEGGPSPAAQTFWQASRDEFQDSFSKFCVRAESFFWNARLAETLQARDKKHMNALAAERDAVFGHAMLGGGLIQRLADMLEELVYIQQRKDRLP